MCILAVRQRCLRCRRLPHRERALAGVQDRRDGNPSGRIRLVEFGRAARALRRCIRRRSVSELAFVRGACCLGIAQPAAAHLLAQSLLGIFCQIVEVFREIAKLFFAHVAVLFSEPAATLPWIDCMGRSIAPIAAWRGGLPLRLYLIRRNDTIEGRTKAGRRSSVGRAADS